MEKGPIISLLSGIACRPIEETLYVYGFIGYLSRNDVEATQLPMPDIIQALETMFIEKGHGRVEMPPKPSIHPRPDAFIHAGLYSHLGQIVTGQ